MKFFTKALSTALALIICLTSLSCVAYAQDKAKSVTVFVDGFASVGIYDESGENLFPPSTDKIMSAVAPVIPGLISALMTEDYDDIKEPVGDAAVDVFEDLVCDLTGKPLNGTADYELPSDEEIIEKVNKNANNDSDDYIYFSYDWRLPVQTLATQLNTLVEHIIEVSDAEKVSLIGFSMGTCVVMSYLKMYGYDDVDGVILLAGAYNGVSSCGEPFAGKIGLDSDATVRFVDAMMGDDFGSTVVSSLLHLLNASGVLDSVVDSAEKLVDELTDVVYGEVFEDTFALIPGMWAMVPYEYYADARKVFENSDKFTKEYLDMIDWYHYEVQAHNDEIINGILERGIRFGIVAKYGYPNTPCIEDINSMSDSVIDTRFESFGATCADVNTTLGENYVQKVDNGHNCISPDNMIDASTAKYCQYTWFIKNSQHSSDSRVVREFCISLLQADEQLTVWSDASKPQFLILVDDEIKVHTKDNDYSLYQASFEDESVWQILIDLFKKIFEFLKQYFAK